LPVVFSFDILVQYKAILGVGGFLRFGGLWVFFAIGVCYFRLLLETDEQMQMQAKIGGIS